jgi:hypothetical protein
MSPLTWPYNPPQQTVLLKRQVATHVPARIAAIIGVM